MTTSLPYKIAVLVYVYDEHDRLLLLHRAKEPNLGLASPPGGKLETAVGESPASCCIREVKEELGWDITLDQIRLMGMISETSFAGKNHWLMFLYQLHAPEPLLRHEFNEGILKWHPIDQIMSLKLPETDRRIIYPLIEKYGSGFFAAHINCDADGILNWSLEEVIPACS